MDAFPRTNIGNLSVSRLIIGTNWFLGFSHCTPAKNDVITHSLDTADKVADIIEVFLNAGVDTILGPTERGLLQEAIERAQDRTGQKLNVIATPTLPFGPRTPEDGFNPDECLPILDQMAEMGADVCMPHEQTTDAMTDRCTRTVRKMDAVCAWIRERGMEPGLSTHNPESIIYADETGLDVSTYISIYNLMGFMMPLEVDWTARIIQNAQRPVLTIKPMAAGQVRPFQGLTFSWNSIRDGDMMAAGTMSAREAAEIVEMSMEILDKRASTVGLQHTRSKDSLRVAAESRV
jgi:hypothetical protein